MTFIELTENAIALAKHLPEHAIALKNGTVLTMIIWLHWNAMTITMTTLVIVKIGWIYIQIESKDTT